jgi:hypothetical protein
MSDPAVIGSTALNAEQERKRQIMIDKFKASHDAVIAASGSTSTASSIADAEAVSKFKKEFDHSKQSMSFTYHIRCLLFCRVFNCWFLILSACCTARLCRDICWY